MFKGHCPEINLRSSSDLRAKFTDGSLIVDVQKHLNGTLTFNLQASEIGFKASLRFNTESIDEQFVSLPLSEDRSRFFVSSKSFGIPAIEEGSTYEYRGTRSQCKNCKLFYDIGRGMFNYQAQWYAASMSTVLKDTGETFSMFLGDGLGVNYNSTLDKA